MLKTISSITNALGALNYKGTWNALTNTPTLADGTGSKGDYYVTSTAGTQTFGGLLLFFGIGDWIAYNGAVWQRVEGGSDGNFANITLNSTDAGASAAPLLDLYRDSASPAASDTLGEIEFNGEDSAGNKQQYALIHASILSPTSTAETGQIHFETATAGASTEKMIIGSSNLVINDIGAVYNVRIEGDTDANLFYTDATNSRVGIGTISPATKLDVSGTITATSIIDSALTSGRVTYAGTAGLLQDSANLTFNGTTLTANTIDAYTLSGTIAGGGNQINNVIIGTSTPLAGSFTSVNATSITNSGLTSGRVTYAGTSGVLQDSSGLVFDSSSNLGVGTSSPTKRLEVHSSTTGGQNARFIDNSGVGGGGRGGGISIGGVSNDTGPVFTDYVRLLGLKTNSTQGNTAGGLLIQVDNGSTTVSAMSISSARIVTMDAYGAGTATFSAAGVISSVSDETWKTKDGVPTNPDAMIQKLQPGYWFYNEEKAPIFGADRQLGFYAQNVHEAIGAEAAPPPEEGKPWGYYDRSVLAVAVMSLKNALNTIEELKQRIEVLENK